MEDKINQSEHVETVADLRKSISRSFIGRTRVRIMAVISRVKRSTQDYRIPVMASTIFVVLILSIAIVRQFQKTTVLAIINQATNGTNDYATLLSIDKTDEFIAETAGEPERDSSGTLITSGNSTQSTSTSFVIMIRAQIQIQVILALRLLQVVVVEALLLVEVVRAVVALVEVVRAVVAPAAVLTLRHLRHFRHRLAALHKE